MYKIFLTYVKDIGIIKYYGLILSGKCCEADGKEEDVMLITSKRLWRDTDGPH
jgi:hypothetical protein